MSYHQMHCLLKDLGLCIQCLATCDLEVSPRLCVCFSWNFLEISSIMLEISPIMLALCFMLSSPHYAKNYASIIDSSLDGTTVGVESCNNSACKTVNLLYTTKYDVTTFWIFKSSTVIIYQLLELFYWISTTDMAYLNRGKKS